MSLPCPQKKANTIELEPKAATVTESLSCYNPHIKPGNIFLHPALPFVKLAWHEHGLSSSRFSTTYDSQLVWLISHIYLLVHPHTEVSRTVSIICPESSVYDTDQRMLPIKSSALREAEEWFLISNSELMLGLPTTCHRSGFWFWTCSLAYAS